MFPNLYGKRLNSIMNKSEVLSSKICGKIDVFLIIELKNYFQEQYWYVNNESHFSDVKYIRQS